jgi:hypothetical protein
MLDVEQIRLLFALETELPSIQASVRLARILADYPDKTECRHPVLVFALQAAQGAPITGVFLRSSEALEMLLDRAAQQFLGRRLIRNEGRGEWSSSTKEFTLAMKVRHRAVAHRVANLATEPELTEEMKREFGGLFQFVEGLLGRIGEVLAELREAGIYKGVDGLSAARRVYAPFTEADVRKLIDVGNRLVRGEAGAA